MLLLRRGRLRPVALGLVLALVPVQVRLVVVVAAAAAAADRLVVAAPGEEAVVVVALDVLEVEVKVVALERVVAAVVAAVDLQDYPLEPHRRR